MDLVFIDNPCLDLLLMNGYKWWFLKILFFLLYLLVVNIWQEERNDFPPSNSRMLWNSAVCLRKWSQLHI